MTRLPKTPEQDDGEKRKEQLARYLSKMSESRQVTFMRCLQQGNLKLDLEQRVKKLKKQRYYLIPKARL